MAVIGNQYIVVFHAKRNRNTVKVFNMTLQDRKSTRLNSSHLGISYAVFCLKKKKINRIYLCHVAKRAAVAVTTNPSNSRSEGWSRDTQWLYFHSARSTRNLVHSPWGHRAPH